MDDWGLLKVHRPVAPAEKAYFEEANNMSEGWKAKVTAEMRRKVELCALETISQTSNTEKTRAEVMDKCRFLLKVSFIVCCIREEMFVGAGVLYTKCHLFIVDWQTVIFFESCILIIRHLRLQNFLSTANSCKDVLSVGY